MNRPRDVDYGKVERWWGRGLRSVPVLPLLVYRVGGQGETPPTSDRDPPFTGRWSSPTRLPRSPGPSPVHPCSHPWSTSMLNKDVGHGRGTKMSREPVIAWSTATGETTSCVRDRTSRWEGWETSPVVCHSGARCQNRRVTQSRRAPPVPVPIYRSGSDSLSYCRSPTSASLSINPPPHGPYPSRTSDPIPGHNPDAPRHSPTFGFNHTRRWSSRCHPPPGRIDRTRAATASENRFRWSNYYH